MKCFTQKRVGAENESGESLVRVVSIFPDNNYNKLFIFVFVKLNNKHVLDLSTHLVC